MNSEVRNKLERMFNAYGYQSNAYADIYYCPHDDAAPVYSRTEVYRNPESVLKDFNDFLGVKNVVEKAECNHNFIEYYGFNKSTPEVICKTCGKEK